MIPTTVWLALPFLLLCAPGHADPKPRPPVIFRLYSDFTCPFCFVAEQSTVQQLLREYDVVLDWRGFELRPDISPGGVDRDELLPGVNIKAHHARIQRFATTFAVDLPDMPAHIPNTRKALAVAEYARDRGRLDAYRGALLWLFWKDGADLEDEAVLWLASRMAGLDPARATGAMFDSEYRRRIDEMSDEAARVGVTAIPTFVFPLSPPLVGCQSWPVIEAAAIAAGARRRIEPAPDLIPPPEASDPMPNDSSTVFP